MGIIFNRDVYEVYIRGRINRETIEKSYIPDIVKKMYLDEPRVYNSLIINVRGAKLEDLTDDVGEMVLPLFASLRRIGKNARFRVSNWRTYRHLKNMGFQEEELREIKLIPKFLEEKTTELK
jgi:hypothetical protein